MTFPVIITPAAESDLIEAIAWYESSRPGLSLDLRLSRATAQRADEGGLTTAKYSLQTQAIQMPAGCISAAGTK